MKIPDTFKPDKNLDQETENLLNKKVTVKPKEVYEVNGKNVLEILADGIDKNLHPGKVMEIKEKAFEKVLNDSYNGIINWKREGKKENYTAKATVIDAKGEEITIPVIFLISRFDSMVGEQALGFLYLGGKEGPCRNTANEKVKKLAETYFKVEVV